MPDSGRVLLTVAAFVFVLGFGVLNLVFAAGEVDPKHTSTSRFVQCNSAAVWGPGLLFKGFGFAFMTLMEPSRCNISLQILPEACKPPSPVVLLYS